MRKIIIGIINFYKKHISSYLEYLGIHCKYEPTCSEYMLQAVEEYGAKKGLILGIKRIIKCNPFSKGGYDPLKK